MIKDIPANVIDQYAAMEMNLSLNNIQ